MGWKLSAIIIKTEKVYEDKEILDSLWESPAEKVEDVTFSDAMHPSDNFVHIGYYKNCFILTTYASELVEKCLVKEIPVIEQIFIGLFPNSIIGAFQLQSTCSYFAYSVLENGVKRRVKSSIDGEIKIDYGLPLKEEEEFFSYRFIDKNKNIMYKMPNKNGEFETYEENAIGEDFVSRVWSKFTGIELFEDDALLDKTFLHSYKFEIEEESKDDNKKSFWKRIFSFQNAISKPFDKTQKTNTGLKYFKNADKLLPKTDNEVECACCHKIKTCFQATQNESVCEDCLTTGQLSKLDLSNCHGDIDELKRQLNALNPNYSEKEIDKIAKLKTEELEITTPQLVTWQDWDWPCADGDYCIFIGYGSQPFYNKLAKNNNGRELFETSFYYKIKDVSDATLWENLLSEKEISNYEDSNEYGVLFYVFKSLNSDKIITTWDCS